MRFLQILLVFLSGASSGYAQKNCSYTMQSRDTLNLAIETYERFYELAPAAGNTTLFCGHFNVNDTTRQPIVRKYLASGSIDTKFGNNGNAAWEGLAEAACISIAADKILVGGGAYDRNDYGYDMFVWILDANGTPDKSFNGTGFASIDVSLEHDDAVTAIARQPDGKIVACGYTLQESTLYVIRYNNNGSLDKSFGKEGVQAFTDMYLDPNSICIQRDNKILIAGTTGSNASYDFALCRLNADGSLDKTFGGDGMVTASVNDRDDEALKVKVMEDDRIAVYGYSWDEDYTTYFTGVLWLPNGERDKSFCMPGYLTKGMQNEEGWNGFEIISDNEFVVYNFKSFSTMLEYSRRVYKRKQ